MPKHHLKRNIIGWLLMICYLAGLLYFTCLAESMGRSSDTRTQVYYNLELFKEIKRFYNYMDILGFRAFFLNVFGNVICFIPFGFIMSFIHGKKRRWYYVLCMSYLLSLSIEMIQLIFKVGSFDVDDLLLNTIGGLVGYLIYIFMRLFKPKNI